MGGHFYLGVIFYLISFTVRLCFSFIIKKGSGSFIFH